MIGETIGHYKISEKLGAGGMGVIYKAEDTRLKRTVALKFLPSDLVLDAEAKERLIHEAKAASSIDHPNICTVYDIDETPDGRLFIAMAYYDGESLRVRIAKRKLPVEQATDIALQVAQGLAKAHEKGIVHRDIKPANIMITGDGVVKIVDFGLAKLSSATKLTKTGSTLGTVAYMAPEQLQGSNVDARADIFSIGVMLYEMLTGKTPFRGDHEAALMYSILNEEPEPLQVHLPDASSELIHVVSRALEKDPANRYTTVEDLLIDLRRVRKETSNVSLTALAGRRRSFLASRRMRALALLMGIAMIAAIVFVVTRPRRLPQVNPNLKTTTLQLPINDPNACSLSRDGKWIAVGGSGQNNLSDIYYLNTVARSSRRVTFDSAALVDGVDCSPDGAWIEYTRFVNGRPEIVLVPSLGGPTRSIALGFLGRFFPSGERILYFNNPTAPGKYELASVKLDGSDKRVEFIDPGYSHKSMNITLSFSLSPDGRSIAWLQTFLDFSQDVVIYELGTMKARQVTFSRSTKGEVFWTRDNIIVYGSFANGNYDLWMCPAEGGEQVQLTRSRNDEMGAYLSDDGSRLLYSERYVTRNVHSMDIQTGKVTPITSDDGSRVASVLSPDNRFVASTVVPSYANWLTWIGFEVRDTKGEHPVRNLCPGEVTIGHRAWSPDGKWIAYTRVPDTAGGMIKICIVSPFEGSSSRVVGEAIGVPGETVILKWFGKDTLSWFSGMKSWMCAVDNAVTTRFYEDSTNARRFPGKDFILYRDYRAGREGWWIDRAVARKGQHKEAPRRILEPTDVQAIAPNGEFCIASLKPGELHKVSLPDGKSTRLPFTWPQLSGYRSISQDGKSVVYSQSTLNSKVVLWEDPFVKE